MMQFRSIIKILLLGSVMLLASCGADNRLIVGMQTAYYGMFKAACEDNEGCIKAVDTYLGECFDRTLASNTLTASTPEKKKSLNESHVRKIQQCLQNKTGTDPLGGKSAEDILGYE